MLRVLDETFAIERLAPDAEIPTALLTDRFVFLARTDEELSIVRPKADGEWRGFRVEGKLDFDLVGILAGLTRPLAEAGIPVFCVSTYDTDYLFVKRERLEDALRVLQESR